MNCSEIVIEINQEQAWSEKLQRRMYVISN